MSTPKSSKNSKNPAPAPKPGFQIRPLEAIGVVLFFFAVIFLGIRGCSGSKKVANQTPAPALADSSQLVVKASNLRPLYIVIDSLKLRSRPQLDSSFIRYLNYDETVYDMGEQTPYMQTIRYSMDEIRTEPWVKVRTAQGEIGWVFGAGVNFYKKKRRSPSPAVADSSQRTAPANTSASSPSVSNSSVSTSRPSSSVSVSRPSGR